MAWSASRINSSPVSFILVLKARPILAPTVTGSPSRQHAFRNCGSFGWIVHLVQQEDKFVSPIASNQVPLSQTALKDSRRMTQYGVARLMPKAVINRFEAI